MQTYRYRFPASGRIGDYREQAETYMGAVRENLNTGQDCLGAYAMFPTDSRILDRVDVDMDSNGSVSSLSLHTYTKLWDGREDDLKECVEENLKAAAVDCFGDENRGIRVEGSVEFLGREGDVPKTLYHIADRKNLDSILENGLVPDNGENKYKDPENHVYLCDMDDLPVWLSVLKHVDDPVILEVDTEGLDGIETGRVFDDRGYTRGLYTEYRTTDPIPASSLKEADLGMGSKLRKHTNNRMIGQLVYCTSNNDVAEVATGMKRLVKMGTMKDDFVDMHVAERMQALNEHHGDMEDYTDDDFTAAISQIPEGGIDAGLPFD